MVVNKQTFSFNKNPNFMYYISFRYMITSTQLVLFARAGYSVINQLTNTDVLNQLNKNNKTALSNGLLKNVLDHSTGTPQHKTALLRKVANNYQPIDNIYIPYKELVDNDSRIKFIEGASVGPGIYNEVATLHEYIKTFSKDLVNILAIGYRRY
jgi:hypothetical protein